MFRYSDDAIILCPSYECYENKEESYYRNMSAALRNIILFLKSKDITPCMLTSDEVACRENPSGVTWLQTMTPGDVIFTRKNCVSVGIEHSNVRQYPELYKKALEKYPIKASKNVDILFDGVLKRTSKTEKEIIKDAKVIFNIQTANNASYNIKPKEGSGVILINVKNGSFLPTCYLGDMEINPIDLLDYPMGNRPIYDWRFD